MMKSILIILFFVGFSYAQTSGDVKFIFKGTSVSDDKIITTSLEFSSLSNTNYFNSTKPTVIFFHGFVRTYYSPAGQAIAEAYIKRGDHNIILVDWSRLGYSYYSLAVKNLPKVKMKHSKKLITVL